MDADGVKQPLLSEAALIQLKRIKRNSSRFDSAKVAPLAEAVPQEANLHGSIQRSKSILGNLHPSFERVAITLAFYLGFGTMCFYLVRNTTVIVGYGDLVPGSILAKLLACAFVFSGMARVVLILSRAADYLVEKQEILLVKAQHLRNRVGPTEMLKKTASLTV